MQRRNFNSNVDRPMVAGQTAAFGDLALAKYQTASGQSGRSEYSPFSSPARSRLSQAGQKVIDGHQSGSKLAQMAIDDDELNVDKECPVCLNIMVQPSLLVCNHRICAQCADRFIIGDKKNVFDNHQIHNCPICRHKLEISELIDLNFQSKIKERYVDEFHAQKLVLQEEGAYKFAPVNSFELSYSDKFIEQADDGLNVFGSTLEFLSPEHQNMAPFIFESVTFSIPFGSSQKDYEIFLDEYDRQKPIQKRFQARWLGKSIAIKLKFRRELREMANQFIQIENHGQYRKINGNYGDQYRGNLIRRVAHEHYAIQYKNELPGQFPLSMDVYLNSQESFKYDKESNLQTLKFHLSPMAFQKANTLMESVQQQEQSDRKIRLWSVLSRKYKMDS